MRVTQATAQPSATIGFRPRAVQVGVDQEARVLRAVLRAQDGDSDAIRMLYLHFKDSVYGYINSFLHDEHEAEDATQHVFLKLISVIHRYEPRAAPFSAWILRVARNVAIDYLRQRRALSYEEVFDASHSAADAGDERRWGLEQALVDLPADQRNVVLMRHLIGLTPGEIATRMGRSEASVHGLHHRARVSLRRTLVDAECAPTIRMAA